MKSIKLLYWLSTGLLVLWMLGNAWAYLTKPEAKRLCAYFGFPDYFRIELAIAKLLGVAALLVPIHGRLKERTYAGFTITVISGFIAHLCSGDTLAQSLSALVALVLLAGSYVGYHKGGETGKPGGLAV